MLFVVSLLSAVLAAGQTPAPTPASAHIAGRVLVEGANTPIAGARVILLAMRRTAGPFGPPPETFTDQDGRYVFQNLAPGNYRIEAQHASFAQSVDPTTMRMIDLVAGQALDDMNIWLPRGGAIAGRVLDPSGAPIAAARVMVMRHLDRPGMESRLVPAPGQGQQTNDLGEFRVYGLAAGTYYVAATPSMMMGGSIGTLAAETTSATTLATTFYPGTTDSATAQPVTVAAGDTVSDVSFTMQIAPAFRISGVVLDESGNPVSGAMVMLTGDPRSSFVGPAGRARTERNGRFVIGGVPAGRYRAMASVPVIVNGTNGGGPSSGISGGVVGGVVFGTAGANGAVAGSASVSGGMTTTPADVIVADADVTGLRIVVHR